MSEFGHFGHGDNIGGAFFIDTWGAGPFVIGDGRRSWRFEFSDRFGPVILNRDDMPSDRQPISERHSFWRPFEAWLAQGKRVAEDGITCLWDEPEEPQIQHLGGRHYLVVRTPDHRSD